MHLAKILAASAAIVFAVWVAVPVTDRIAENGEEFGAYGVAETVPCDSALYLEEAQLLGAVCA